MALVYVCSEGRKKYAGDGLQERSRSSNESHAYALASERPWIRQEASQFVCWQYASIELTEAPERGVCLQLRGPSPAVERRILGPGRMRTRKWV
jgi:hypothetical protein